MALRRALVCILAVILAACSEQPAEEARPAIWEVRGPDGAQAWLFGTVHALPAGIDWRTPALDRALDEADRLVFEIDPRNDDPAAARRVFLRLGATPGLPPLASRVRPGLRDELVRMIEDADVDEAAASRLEDWAAALTLAQAEAARQGATTQRGVESALIGRAGGRAVAGLETVAGQFAVFDALPSAAQSALLEAVVAESADPESGTRLLAAWAHGDVAALEREGRSGMLADPILRRELLIERNAAWGRQIEAMLRRGEHPFVAVGAAHLAGTNGLPALLATRGWKVTRVQ